MTSPKNAAARQAPGVEAAKNTGHTQYTAPSNQLLPPMGEAELTDLEGSIRERGVIVPVILDAATGEVVDGHNRKAIAERLKVEFPTATVAFKDDADRLKFIIDLNTARRHLDAETRSRLRAKYAEAVGVKLSDRGGKRANAGRKKSKDIVSLDSAETAPPNTVRVKVTTKETLPPTKISLTVTEKTPPAAIEKIAKDLGVSPRTLRRDLAKNGEAPTPIRPPVSAKKKTTTTKTPAAPVADQIADAIAHIAVQAGALNARNFAHALSAERREKYAATLPRAIAWLDAVLGECEVTP